MIPAIVTQVSQQAARDEQGVVSGHYVKSLVARVAFERRENDLAFTGVYRDGDLVYVHVTRDVNGGRQATPAQVAQETSQYEHPGPAQVFHAPWDPRYLREYTYRVIDDATIGFTSLVKDTAHGSGTFSIDTSKHVVSYAYVMSANWQYATSGNISGTRGQVVPGYWATTTEVQHYTGRHGLFGVTAVETVTQSDFQRFSSLADAEISAAAAH